MKNKTHFVAVKTLRRLLRKKGVLSLILLATATGILSWWLWTAYSSDATVTKPPSRAAVETQRPIAQHNHATMERTPAYLKVAPQLNTLRPTLAPELFHGNERLAYQAAKEIPQTLAQLPCYCHCDKGHGHQSLHSCFETEHGENCGICIGEALMAYNLEKRAKLNVVQIRERIIAAYGYKADDRSK